MKQQGLLKVGLQNGVMGKEIRCRSYLIHALFTLDFYGSETTGVACHLLAPDR